MIKPIYALVGDDSFLQIQAIDDIAKNLSPDAVRINIDGESAQLADVLDEVRSFAMFGGGDKLVIVRDADKFVSNFREQLEDYALHPSSSATLILRLASLPKAQRIYKAIDKTGLIILCESPSMTQLPQWIVKRGKSVHRIDVVIAAATLLADRIGADLGKLDNELAKLAIDAGADGKVDANNVSGGVAFQREQELHVLVNAMSQGNTVEAIRKWRQLIDADSSMEFRAVTWLSGWLNDVSKAVGMRKKRVPDAVIAKACRVWDFKQIAPFMKLVDGLGEAGVARGIDLLSDVDRRSKSGLGDAVGNVERFIIAMAQQRRTTAARMS